MRHVSSRGGTWCVLCLLVAVCPAAADFSPEEVWASRCGTCHTVGEGDDVGPDLLGIHERRERDWLIDFIRSSAALIESGDETAVALFEEFGRQKMPDHPYSRAQIEQLLDWIRDGGPEDPGPTIRAASTATPDERRLGRELFFGERRFAAGGAACAQCHSVDSSATLTGLGGDLSRAYARFRDVELSYLLTAMETPLMVELYGHRPLTQEEAFCVKAFLADPGRAAASREPWPRRGLPWWIAVTGLSLAMVVGDGALHARRAHGVGDGS